MMTRFEKALCWGPGPILVALVPLIVWPPGRDRAAMAGFGQSVATLYALLAALLIAGQTELDRDVAPELGARATENYWRICVSAINTTEDDQRPSGVQFNVTVSSGSASSVRSLTRNRCPFGAGE